MEPKSRPRGGDRAVAALAETQHGVVSMRQLAAIGLSRGAVRTRVHVGRLHVVHRGVFAVGYGRLTLRGRWMAAVLATGEGALLGYWSAGTLWELVRSDGAQVHVIAPGGSRLDTMGIVKHRARNLHSEDRAEEDGIQLSSVARTLLDLAPAMHPQRLARALEDAERRRLLDANAIRRVCDRNRGHRGSRRLLRQLTRHGATPDTRSPLERRFAEFCHKHGLPLPVFNTMVAGFEVDALWPRERMIVELDSWDFHRTRDAFERDRARDAELMLAGYRVVRLTWRRLEEAPDAVARSIRRLLAECGRGLR